MIDTDLLAIQRKRRQQKRCLACGTPTPRAALCGVCRETLRYCPRCESVYDALFTSQRSRANGRSTAYCLPCASRVRNYHGRTIGEYLAAQRERKHPQLEKAIRLYKRGLTYVQIADALGMNRGTLRSLVTHARRTGRWPASLKRQRRAA
jgi:hypothetical protein